MKKDILYTVNKHNKPQFAAHVDRVHHNIFDGADNSRMLRWDRLASGAYGTDYGNTGYTLEDYMTGTTKEQGNNSWLHISKEKNPLSKGNIGNTMKGIGTAAITAIPDEELDYADPLWHVAGGRHSGLGNGMGSMGKDVFKAGATSGNPYMMLAGAGLKIGGDLVNLGWGYNIGNEKNVKNNINRLAGVKFKAGDHDTLASQYGKTNLGTVSLGKVSNGLFNHKGSKIADDLAYTQNTLADFAYRDYRNQGLNIDKNTLGNDMRTSYAFGGDMSTIDYGLAQDFLTIQKEKARNKNKMDGMGAIAFANGYGGGGCLCKPYCKGGTLFALGGDVQMNGADYSTGLTHVDAGSSHELNPNEGVQIGVDPEGVPNLVEEGETIFNDYVYSNRIELDDEAKERFHFSKKRDITYADAAKSLEKEIAERPNDPVSKAGFKVQMEQLAEEQERQKAEMEATRAREAFEALSPEEQVAVMDNLTEMRDTQAAQEEVMAQEAAQQQMSPEEAAMMQQQAMEEQAAALQQPTQPVVGMGAEAAVPQEAPDMMAEGGNLFPWGGYEKLFDITPPYAASNTVGFIPYTRDLTDEEVLEREKEQRFIDWTNYVNNNWDSSYIQNYLRALDAAAGGNHLFDKDGKILPEAKKYFNHARTGNHKWGYYHLTPEQVAANRVFHAVEGDDDYLPEDQSKWVNVGAVSKKKQLPNGDVVIYHNAGTPGIRTVGYSKIGQTSPIEQRMVMDENGLANVITTPVPTEEVLRASEEAERKAQAGKAAGTEADGLEPVPVYRDERLRYAGLLGPAVGLGMQMAGIGKPDTRSLQQVAEDFARNSPDLATYKPIGNYMRYRPIDIWAEQAALNAQSRATDRAISNTSNPAKMAGLVANGLNSQIASGDALRKDTAANLAQNMQVENFNKGTDVFNAEAFNRTSATNAEMRNRYNQYLSQLRMGSAQAKMAADANWYQGIYGNVGSLFKGISDLGRENAQHNMIAEMAANGIFGPMSPSTWVGKHGRYLTWRPKQNSACKGGKISKRKG